MSTMVRTRASARTNRRAWSLVGLAGPVIGIANGVVRRAVYDKPLGELRAPTSSPPSLRWPCTPPPPAHGAAAWRAWAVRYR